VLVAVGFATDRGASRAPAAGVAPVAVIARRVEAIRGLRFTRLPAPQRVTAAQATRDGLADFDRANPPARRHAEEALYERLGLLPRGTDLRRVEGSVFGDQVAGYYDPRSQRLRIVQGAGTANRVLDEMTLAHELTHALEDQRFGLDEAAADASDDRGYAYRALVEGTATALMYEYVLRYFARDTALGGLLGGAFAGGTGAGLPPFVLAGLVFPYDAGRRFVEWVYRRAGGRWTLVDLAERVRPPVSTEQILHPEKWLRFDPPLRVSLADVARRLGRGWTRLAGGTFGEWQTAQLLARSGHEQPAAAAGWGGDRYALWRRGGRDVVAIRWRWDTRRDAREFAPVLRAAVADLPHHRVRAAGRRTTLIVRG
jgi:hypothetical protein